MVDPRRLLEKNRRWAAERKRRSPHFFERLVAIQKPAYLWIGCSDSRVPANQIVGLDPGEMFVHRNIANVVPGPGRDPNSHSVIQFAVHNLGVEHIIVCGHYGCGGVAAALDPDTRVGKPLDGWLDQLRALRDSHADELAALPDPEARSKRLSELNVVAGVGAVAALSLVQSAWENGQDLGVHGWIYDLHDGVIHDLEVSVAAPSEIALSEAT